MTCGPDCIVDLPKTYVVAVVARGRTGYGISWGTDGSRNEGRQIHQEEGSMCCTGGILSGVLHVLKDAEKRNEKQVLIYISATHVGELLTDPTHQKPLNCSKNLIREITECKVKAIYRTPCSYDDNGFRMAIIQARLATGTHSLAPNPINDNLFKNGVIGVAIYGEFRKLASGEMRGAFAMFFEEGFLSQVSNKDMNRSEWAHRAIDSGNADFIALLETLRTLLREEYRQVRIKTCSQNILRWITLFEKGPDYDHSKCRPLQALREVYKMFCNVKVEFDSEGGSVLKAKKMVDELFESTVDGLYWKNGVPVVYTNGSVQGKDAKAVGGGGVFWGPDDPRNRTIQPITLQSNNSGELAAVSEALKTAIEKNISHLLIRTNSQSIIDNITLHSPHWKQNGWMKSNGKPIKNREFLMDINKLMGKMKYVDFEKVHTGNEGNEGANRLAKDAIREAYKKLKVSN